MKKLMLLILVAFLGISNAFAQKADSSQTNQADIIDRLTTRLNTLQEDFDNLYCEYKISQMENKINDFIHDLSRYSLSLDMMSIHHTKCNFEAYKTFLEAYNAYKKTYDLLEDEYYRTQEEVKPKQSSLSISFVFVSSKLSSAKRELAYFKQQIDRYRNL